MEATKKQPKKVEYKGFEIEAKRELSLSGEKLLYFSVYRISDGYECVCDFEDSKETIKNKIEELKQTIDKELQEADPWGENE